MSQEFLFLFLALLLVLANGFFVATEFAIVKIRPTRLQAMVDEGRPGAANAMRMVENLDGYLSATQFGITLASLGLGWLGEPAFAHLLEPLFTRMFGSGESTQALIHSVAVGFSFGIITFLHIVVGELAPKSLAIQKAEAVTLIFAWPMRLFYFVFFPGIWLLNGMARKLLHLFGLTSASETHEAHNEEELQMILASSAQAGAITASRAELLSRALGMLEKTARQVLVPRSQVRYLDLEEPMEHNIQEARASGHTWLPVCRGSMDQVEGVVNVKDLLYLLAKGELSSLAQVQRAVLFVPENVTLEQLLSEFRRRKRQLAVVVDEHGGTSGIVTIADVVAELVGNVAELGRKVDEVRALPGGRLELPGTSQIDDLEDRLGIEFPVDKDEITTVAGYLMLKLGRVPEPGDKVAVGEGFVIRTVETDGPRVIKVVIEPNVPAPTVVKPGEAGLKPVVGTEAPRGEPH